MITVTKKDWLTIARKYYKSDKDYEFKCASCGNKQSINSVKNNNPDLTVEEISNFISCNCEGRHNDKIDCDWTLGGLLKIHELEVLDENGNIFGIFSFYDDKAMKELELLKIDVSDINKKRELLSSGTLWICNKDFECQSNKDKSSKIIKSGDILEFRYHSPANFRTVDGEYYSANIGSFVANCDLYGNINEDVRFQNRDSLSSILKNKSYTKTKTVEDNNAE